MEHRVIAYSGSRFADEPREFYLGEERHLVTRVICSSLEQSQGLEGLTRQVWKVIDDSGEAFTLTHHRTGDFWEIVRG